jgi:hypothetical protein
VEFIIVHLTTSLSETNHYVEVIDGTESQSTCCGKHSPHTEGQQAAPLCVLCQNVKKRREKEAQRRANGTHGKQTSILQSNWFSPR